MQDAVQEPLRSWATAEPTRAATWLAHVGVPWWIAGGWALDLFLDKVGRHHADLDIGVFRRDIVDVLAALPEWECFEARGGALTRLAPGAAPRADVHSLWCRPAGTAEWVFEIMLDASDGDSWLFRREPLIRRPLSTLTRVGASGIRYLAPEIQLLYKAKAVRPNDQADFDRVVPRLDEVAGSWLRDSLAKTSPGHAWLTALGRFDGRGA